MSTPFSHFFQHFKQISPLETDFTGVLDAIAVKPKILYFHGKMPENVLIDGLKRRPKCVAIVGSRRNSKYGEEVAYKMAYELAKRGVVIISGLAYGIDSIGHRAALDAGGVTVAVLGTQIDRIYPTAHLGLAREIVEQGGVVMSEYGPGVEIFPKTSFLERNRLISGLADVVVVVEAAERSGTLNTAMYALDQGKDLLAVPGNITSKLSVGCNRLIQQGALPYTGLDDVLDLLFPAPKRGGKLAKQGLPLGETAEEVAVIKLLAEGARNGEEIVERLGMRTNVFNQTMTMLEIKGVVRGLGANEWVLR